MAVQEVGQWIREIRYTYNLTQEWLAECLDVHVRTVQRWEAGGMLPRARMLRRLEKMERKLSQIMP